MKTYAKENYISNISDTILNHDSNSESFWQLMGRFMGKNVIQLLYPLCVQIMLTMHSLMKKKLIYLMIIFAVFQVSTNPI